MVSPLGSTVLQVLRPDVVQTASNLRFLLQSEAARLLPAERVSKCLRWLAPVHKNLGEQSPRFANVELRWDPERRKASYGNLILCSSVWHCPVCSSTIANRRRKVLSEALDSSHLHCVLATFTLSHHKAQSLDYVLTDLLTAYRKMKSGRWWQGFIKRFGWEGDIRCLEVTYGKNGFHPHIHAIMCFQTLFDEITTMECENALKVRFEGVLAQSGAYASHDHSVRLSDDMAEVRDYITKFGKLPKSITKKGWTIENELTQGHTKTSRSKDGETAWTLLALSLSGSADAGELFIEYAKTCKGRNQLVYSRGFQARLGILDIDGEPEDTTDNRHVVGLIDKYEWYKVCELELRCRLLDVVKTSAGDLDTINNWLIEQLKEI